VIGMRLCAIRLSFTHTGRSCAGPISPWTASRTASTCASGLEIAMQSFGIPARGASRTRWSLVRRSGHQPTRASVGGASDSRAASQFVHAPWGCALTNAAAAEVLSVERRGARQLELISLLVACQHGPRG
jgi:hypothetical protein